MNETKVEQMLRAAGACVIALGLLLVPVLFPSFLVYQFSLTLTYAIAILGLNLLMGFNGQISVAHGVFFAVGGYTTAIFMSAASTRSSSRMLRYSLLSACFTCA